eukprot:11186510-Lingulodinium_polyedra.AAC.1
MSVPRPTLVEATRPKPMSPSQKQAGDSFWVAPSRRLTPRRRAPTTTSGTGTRRYTGNLISTGRTPRSL